MKRIIQIIVWMLVFAGFCVVVGFAMADQQSVKCTGVNISVRDSDKPGFINQKDIRKYIYDGFDSLTGQYIRNINTEGIEQMLSLNPYIADARVYSTVQGEVMIEVVRHEALVRIINQDNEGYYLSKKGTPMPLKRGVIPKLPLASGFISEKLSNISGQTFLLNPANIKQSPLLGKVHHIADELTKNDFMSRYITQIYVDEKGQFELTPSDGKFNIILGDANDIPLKFENFIAFYKGVAVKMEADSISSVNLKFINQVVCKK